MREEEEEQQATVIERVRSSTGEMKELRRQKSRRFTQMFTRPLIKFDASLSLKATCEGEKQPTSPQKDARTSSISFLVEEQAAALSLTNPLSRDSFLDGDRGAEGSNRFLADGSEFTVPTSERTEADDENGASSVASGMPTDTLITQPSCRKRPKPGTRTVFIKIPEQKETPDEPQKSDRYDLVRQSMTLRTIESMALDGPISTPLSPDALRAGSSHMTWGKDTNAGHQPERTPKPSLTEEQRSKLRNHRRRRVFQDAAADLSVHSYQIDNKLLDIVQSVSSLFPPKDKRETEELMSTEGRKSNPASSAERSEKLNVQRKSPLHTEGHRDAAFRTGEQPPSATCIEPSAIPNLKVSAFLASDLEETALLPAAREYSAGDDQGVMDSAIIPHPPRSSLLARPPASDTANLDVIDTDHGGEPTASVTVSRKTSGLDQAATTAVELVAENVHRQCFEVEPSLLMVTQPDDAFSGGLTASAEVTSPIIRFQSQENWTQRRESGTGVSRPSEFPSLDALSPFSTFPTDAVQNSPGSPVQRQRSGSGLSSGTVTPIASPPGSRQTRRRRRSTVQVGAGLCEAGNSSLAPAEQSQPNAKGVGASPSLGFPLETGLIRNVEDLELLTTGVPFRNEVRLIMLRMIVPDCEKPSDDGTYHSQDEFEGTAFGATLPHSTSTALAQSRRSPSSSRGQSPQSRALRIPSAPLSPPTPKRIPHSRRVNLESPHYVMHTVAESSRQEATEGTALVSSGNGQSPSLKDAAAIAEANTELAAATALALQRNAPSVASLPVTGVRQAGWNLSPSGGDRKASNQRRSANRLAELVLKSGKHIPGQDARNRAATTSLLRQVADSSMHIFVSAAEVDWVVRRTNLLAKAKREARLEAKRAREQEGLAALATRLLEDEKSKNHQDEFDDLLRERQECLMETLSAWYARISFRLLETEEERRARADRLDGGTSITVPDAQTAGGCFAFATSVGCCAVS
jgi:hypothetical protein